MYYNDTDESLKKDGFQKTTTEPQIWWGENRRDVESAQKKRSQLDRTTITIFQQKGGFMVEKGTQKNPQQGLYPLGTILSWQPQQQDQQQHHNNLKGYQQQGGRHDSHMNSTNTTRHHQRGQSTNRTSNGDSKDTHGDYHRERDRLRKCPRHS